MAATITFTAVRPRRVSIDTIPTEILDKIFSFASDHDCDLSLALTSRSMAHKLRHHPMLRVLFGLLTDDQLKTIFREHFTEDRAAACSVLLEATKDSPLCRTSLAGARWCSASFVGRIQIMLIKRILKTYWDPLQARDIQSPSALSHEYIWAELDEFERQPAALENEWLIESRVDAVKGRYPWSRVYIWPKQGRVLIRDQLVNGCVQYDVGLLQALLGMK